MYCGVVIISSAVIIIIIIIYHYLLSYLYIKLVQYSYNVRITTNRLSNELRNFSLCNCSFMLETFLFQCVHNSYAVPYTLFNENLT